MNFLFSAVTEPPVRIFEKRKNGNTTSKRQPPLNQAHLNVFMFNFSLTTERLKIQNLLHQLISDYFIVQKYITVYNSTLIR